MDPLFSPVTADQRLAAYQALLRHVEEIGDPPSAAVFFERLAQRAGELIPFDIFSLWAYDASDQMIRQVLVTIGGKRLPLIEAPANFGPAGRAISGQQPIVLPLDAAPAPPIAVALFKAGFRVMCVVPATSAETHWGLLGIASRDADEYSNELVALLLLIAARAASILSRLPSSRREAGPRATDWGSTDRIQLLLRMTSAVTSERHLPDVLNTISMLLRETIPHHWASISLWDEEARGLRRWAAVQPHSSTDLIPEGELLDRDEPPWLAFESGDVIEISKSSFDGLRTKVTDALVASGVQAGVCLPLKTPRGKYGVLNVGSPNPDAFPLAEILLLWQVARQLALAIENAIFFDTAERYRQEASRDRDRFKLLLEVNNTLVSQLETHSLWTSVLETVRRTLNHDYASLVILDGATRELRVEAATYYDERGVLEPQVAMSLDQSPAVLAFQWSAPVVFKGPELDQFDVAGVPTLRSAGLRSVCCVPLSTRRGVLGALNIASRHEDAFNKGEVDLLRDIAGQVAIAVENTLAFREISDLKNRLAEEKLYLEGEITSRHDFKEIVGNSPALQSVLRQIQTVAPTDATVLLLGETGTGKELLARALHDLSLRRSHPFIRLNGAALPVGLIESELFGYEKGAFTGAISARAGRLELANRGTLFLDEVGDLPLEVQPKLLRALQEREFERLGSSSTHRVDVRLVAATNRNLDEMVAGSSFRSDLYYRISVFPIQIPALRDRPGDIPILVRHFAQKISREMGREITTIPKSTMDALQQWHWPGNIRELQNVIERAVILSTGSVLQVPAASVQTIEPHRTPVSSRFESQYRMGERAMILKALSESKGIIAGPAGAAARLGLKRTTLHSKMQKLGIKRQRY